MAKKEKNKFWRIKYNRQTYLFYGEKPKLEKIKLDNCSKMEFMFVDEYRNPPLNKKYNKA